MRYFWDAKKLGPDCTFIHCLRVYLLLVSPVTAQGDSTIKGGVEQQEFYSEQNS